MPGLTRLDSLKDMIKRNQKHDDSFETDSEELEEVKEAENEDDDESPMLAALEKENDPSPKKRRTTLAPLKV